MTPTVTISFDLELAWGSFDHRYGKDLLDCARWTHDYAVSSILSHLSETQLSATWAIVGLVMLDRFPPLEHYQEVHYPHFPKPWFCWVPKERGEAEAPEWLGGSLLRAIRAAQPAQEVGFHAFSHVIFGSPGTPRERVQQELRSCMDIARQLGLDAKAFVFPRNSVAYLDELRQAGFRCFRSLDHLPWRPLPIPKGRAIASVLADFLGVTPRTVLPCLQNGLVEIPGSLMIRHAQGWRKLIPDACRLRRLRQGLRQVVDKGGIFHVWLHPENLYYERPRIENVLVEFFHEVASAVTQGKVRCLTMGQVAEEFLVHSKQGVDPGRLPSDQHRGGLPLEPSS